MTVADALRILSQFDVEMTVWIDVFGDRVPAVDIVARNRHDQNNIDIALFVAEPVDDPDNYDYKKVV